MDAENRIARARDGRAETLVELYERAGYLRVEPAILQPADIFLELSGEELRRRLFLTSDVNGRELCLRPDLTIPTCRAHIEKNAPAPATYCYLGSVFRDRGGGAGEYVQAGIESLGRDDLEAADAECLSLALESAKHFGVARPAIRMGDVGLFSALVAALNLPPAWQRRLLKDFNRTGTLAADLATLKHAPAAPPAQAGVLAALQGSDPAAARAFVADLFSIAGISAVGGRTVDEIAERFLEQAALGATSGLGAETTAVLERYLSIEGDPTRLWRRCARSPRTPSLSSPPRSIVSSSAPDSSPPAAPTSPPSASPPPSAERSITIRAWCSSFTTRRTA